MNILGIETSCDETAAAVVKDGAEVLSNVVYTQIPLHQPYGGVVPEIASRAHVEKIREVVGEAMRQFYAARSTQPGARIDAVAVTYGPGLAPALIVGLNAAKGLAKALNVPLIGVNHIEAHLHTPFLFDAGEEKGELRMTPESCTPALGLAVSGGNTIWVDMEHYGDYKVIGETLDDAAGEAFDKAAKLLGLGYPGGLKIDRMSAEYAAKMRDEVLHSTTPTSNSNFIPFPKGRPREGVSALSGLPAELCVSFSGLKTALLRFTEQHPEVFTDKDFLSRVVASYQEAIAGALADRTRTALKRRKYKSFLLGGGVSLNSRIREVLTKVAAEAGVPLLMAKPKYTGDNGAMIAALAYYRQNATKDAFTLDATPSLGVGKS